MLPSIHAITVTYHSGSSIVANVESYIHQVAHLFIVDNGSDAETLAHLEQLKNTYPNQITLIKNSTNLGLAAAQNIGIKKALEQGAKWIALFDDDSRATPNMAANMLATLNTHPRAETIGIIAPAFYDDIPELEPRFIAARNRLFFRIRQFKNDPYIDNICAVIASGSLTRAILFKELGLLREEFFIDYVDSEFCLRARAKGWNIMAVRDAALYHTLGEKKAQYFLGKRIITSNHSASRRYTIYRNRIHVWRGYWKSATPYVLYDFLAAGFDIFRISCFESDKIAKLKAIFRGIKDGLFGQTTLTP